VAVQSRVDSQHVRLVLLLLLVTGVTLGKSFNLSLPQFPHLQNRNINNSNFIGMLWGCGELVVLGSGNNVLS
jgi:hypothetical protein